MVTISDLTSDSSITGIELFIADNGSGGNTLKVALSETTTTASGSLTQFLKAYIANVGLTGLKFTSSGITFADGSIMTTAATISSGSTTSGDLTFVADSDGNSTGSLFCNIYTNNILKISNDGSLDLYTKTGTSVLNVNSSGNLTYMTNKLTVAAATGNTVIAGTLQVTGNITGTLATAAQPNITSIGTLTALSVSATSSTFGDVTRIGQDANSAYFGANFTSTGANYIKSQAANQIMFNSASGSIIFKTATSGTAGNAITFTEQMVLTNTGILTVNNGVTVSGGGMNIYAAGKLKMLRAGNDYGWTWQVNSANTLTLVQGSGGEGISMLTYTDGGVLTVVSTTASTSTTTGALVVSGGVGVAGSTIVGGDIYTVAMSDYGGTSTVTGWTSFSSKNIFVKKIGKMVFVHYAIEGVSNATSASFTLPYQNNGGNVLIVQCGFAKDNGDTAYVEANMQMSNGSATCNFYKNFVDSWTNSSTKAIYGEFFYYTNS